MSRETILPDIPDEGDGAISALKEVVEVGVGRRGDPLDRFVTLRDLKSGGLAEVSIVGGSGSITGGGGAVAPGGGPGGDPLDFGEDDLTKPPRPTGVVARGLSLDTILVRWNPPAYNNHNYAEIFGSFRDNVNEVRGTFDPLRPISATNNTSFFMGRSTTTQFLHEELLSTIPVLQTDYEIIQIGYQQIGANWYALLSLEPGLSPGLFAIGVTVTLRDDLGQWELQNQQGVVDQTILNNQGELVQVRVGPLASRPISTSSFTCDPDTCFVVNTVADVDELDAALSPNPIYYWVRFISTANVVGEFQSEEGIRGAVQVDPEAVLNILTNRINSSQLTNDLRSPIDWARGPVNELNEDGTRRFPTVRSFVESLSDGAVQQYDEELDRVFLGYIQGTTALTIPVFQYSPSSISGRASVTVGDQSGVDYINKRWRWKGGGVGFELLDGQEVTVLSQSGIQDGKLFLSIRRSDNGPVPEPVGASAFSPVQINAVMEGIEDEDIAFQGISTAAAYVRRLTAETSANEAYFRSLETQQAAFEIDTDGNVETVEDLRQIIATISERRLVRATDEGSIAEIDEQVGLRITGGGEPSRTAGNQTLSEVTVDHDGRLRNSFTVKLQQTQDDLLYTAGFGLALEEGSDGDINSQFIVSANDFAIISPVAEGVKVVGWIVGNSDNSIGVITTRQIPGEWLIDRTDDTPWSRDLALSVTRDINHPAFSEFEKFLPLSWRFFASGAALTGTYSVSTPQFGEEGPGPYVYYSYTIPLKPELVGEKPVPELTAGVFSSAPALYKRPAIQARGAPNFLALNAVLAYESSVPFIVDSTRNLVAIRGHLVVDGLISADNIEVNELLTANEIWAQYITTYGLAATNIVSDQMATFRRGGWALRMKSPDGGENKVLQLGRWLTTTDDGEAATSEVLDNINSFNYPQLQGSPDEEAFFLDANFGSVYMRGFLEVGSGARIWTGGRYSPGTVEDPTPEKYVVQIDDEFPMLVTTHQGINAITNTNIPDTQTGYSAGQILATKRDALFWLNRDGTAGFNTKNDAIYIDDEPLALPTAGGRSAVFRPVRRLNVGLARSQVSAMCTLGWNSGSQPLGTDRFLGVTYGLWLWPNDAPLPAPLINGTTDVVVFRGGATDNYQTYRAAMQANSFSKFVAEGYDSSGVTTFVLQGVADGLNPAVTYRTLLVVVERFGANGPPWPAEFSYDLVFSTSFFAQQVSRTQYNQSGAASLKSAGVPAIIEAQSDQDGAQEGIA